MQRFANFGDLNQEELINPKVILSSSLNIFMAAFNDLQSERDITKYAAIPWSSIELWANAYDLTGDLKDDLHHYVRKLDDAYIEDLIKTNGNTGNIGKSNRGIGRNFRRPS